MAHSNWLYQTRDIMFQIKECGVEKPWARCVIGLRDDDIDSFDVNLKVCYDGCAYTKTPMNGAKFAGGNEHAVTTPDSFRMFIKPLWTRAGPQLATAARQNTAEQIRF